LPAGAAGNPHETPAALPPSDAPSTRAFARLAPGTRRGLDGGIEPTYLDFAYFSAVIGMTSQVVGVARPPMRRMVLLHGLVSFGLNLMVLALTLNLIASALD
jgi:uncharacterized membrane protein